jgi:monoamine oxidase
MAGSTAMYMAMAEMGHAQPSPFTGPPKLSKPPAGASVLILGAGVAGMVAAMELRDAGYRVQLLEYNDRPGGRNWSLYGGDTFTELGGATQHIQFDKGLYLNPGPWRIPYHHQGILHYASRLGVAMEPFTQLNYNAYVHSTAAYGGRPRRYREIQADFQGHVAELLGKSVNQGALDQAVTREDREILRRRCAIGALSTLNTGMPRGSRRRVGVATPRILAAACAASPPPPNRTPSPTSSGPGCGRA